MVPSGDIVERHIISEIERLQEENDRLRNWIRGSIETPKCVVCGKEIENVSIQRILRPYLWCSRKCFEYKPRKIIKLEKKYKDDIVGVLKETTRTYGNIKAQCDALGISIPYFYSIVNKYCEKDYISFMAENATGKRRDTYIKKIDKQQRAKGLNKLLLANANSS